MSKGEKIIVIRNTSFDLSSGEAILGEFSLFMDSHSVYGFEWFPDPSYDETLLSESNVPSHVTVSFSYVAHILCKENSSGSFSIKITLEESSRLPWFTFRKESSLILEHMFEFLVFKKAISSQKMNESHYKKYSIIHAQRTHSDIFGYVPTHSLEPGQIVSIAEHNNILKKLNYQAIMEPRPRITRDEFCELLKADKTLKAYIETCSRGIDDESRPYMWPVLLGMYQYDASDDQIEECLHEKLLKYNQLKDKWNSLTKEQFDMSRQLMDIVVVSENDVKRNDRSKKQFAGDDNPNLDLLRHVMRIYAIYNRDCGYVQGIGDIVSQMIILFIKDWEKGADGPTAIFFDGKRRSADEAESYIFWAFTGMMRITQQDRIFGDLNVGQSFILSKASDIAFAIHPPLKKLINESEMPSLTYLFQSVLLLFKRDFKEGDVFRIWDSIISSKKPYVFSRYMIAAILILIFPKLLVHSDGSICDAMDVTGGFLLNANVERILQLSLNISDYIDNLPPAERSNFNQQIPHNTADISYKPKFLKLLP